MPGQKNICDANWVDCVVRTVNPIQLHIKCIERDEQFWEPNQCQSYLHFMINAYCLKYVCLDITKFPVLDNQDLNGYVSVITINWYFFIQTLKIYF